MTKTLSAQDERRALADRLAKDQEWLIRHGGVYSETLLKRDEVAIILAALRADPARGAEEWNYDLSAAPKGSENPVLVTVPAYAVGHAPFVGEAYFYESDGSRDGDEGWWWAGTSPGDYYASPIRETNAEPIAWRHLPEPARALSTHPKHGGEDA